MSSPAKPPVRKACGKRGCCFSTILRQEFCMMTCLPLALLWLDSGLWLWLTVRLVGLWLDTCHLPLTNYELQTTTNCRAGPNLWSNGTVRRCVTGMWHVVCGMWHVYCILYAVYCMLCTAVYCILYTFMFTLLLLRHEVRKKGRTLWMAAIAKSLVYSGTQGGSNVRPASVYIQCTVYSIWRSVAHG